MAGTRATRSRRPAATAAVRRERALELFVAGRTYLDIGKDLGVTRSRAHKIVTDALTEHAKARDEIAERALPIVLARLDALWRPQYAHAIKGDADAANVCLRILDRYIKVQGLDRATVDLTVTTRGELDAEIEQLIANLAP